MLAKEKIKNLKKGLKEIGKALHIVIEIAQTLDKAKVPITIRGMSEIPEEEKEGRLLEKFAVFEYEKWLRWTRAMITLEDISYKRKKRWERQQKIPFKSLCEYDKNFYREAATRILNVIKEDKGEMLKMEFIENRFDEPIYTVLNKGDYAYLHRRLEVKEWNDVI